ncbi:MAG: TRAP transporter large permease [Pseudomonadota bacterium]
MGGLVALTLFGALILAAPIAVALGLAAMAGLVYMSPDFLVLMPQKMLSGVDSFTLLAIPLFILAGTIMGRGGIARRIVSMALTMVGRFRGGLGFVVILSTMFFSGVCGSASADTAAVGSATMPEMLKRKYPRAFATALLAASGATASLIPPSIDLIIIGVVSGVSIGGLFAAGLLPGLFNGLALLALCYYFGRKLDLPITDPMHWREKLHVFSEGFLALLMPAIILGGILGGIFTPTEASAVAVVYGLIVSLFVYREIGLADLPALLLEAGKLTGMVLFVLAAASAFSFVLAFERIPQDLAAFIIEYARHWMVFVLMVNIMFFLLGMIMDALPAIIILMPILVPAGIALGMDPLHIGIFVAANVSISLFTPPVGVCLYVACGLSKLPIEAVFRPLLPFLAVLLMTLMIISYVPEITIFFPRALGYNIMTDTAP